MQRNKFSIVITTTLCTLLATAPLAAKEKRTAADGLAACYEWCQAHNKTKEALDLCYKKCEHYWYCNGSDATPQWCAAHPAPSHVTLSHPVTKPDQSGTAPNQSIRPQP